MFDFGFLMYSNVVGYNRRADSCHGATGLWVNREIFMNFVMKKFNHKVHEGH